MKFVNFIAFIILCAPCAGFAADDPAKAGAARNHSSNLESAQSYSFVSRINAEPYEISVYVPKCSAPKAGFPTIYVLDGGNLFGTFVNAVSNEGSSKEIEPAVVVGISNGSGKNGSNRTFDFTPSDLTAYEKEVIVDLGKNPEVGGYENFLRVIREEIKPKVAKLAFVDPHRDIIFGWSLGGQFVVHTMLVHPDAFSTFIALSSSLWYANKAVFNQIPAFEQKITASNQRLSFWIGAGSLEQERSPGMMQWPLDQKKLSQEITYVNIVGNTLDFSARMRPFFKDQKLNFNSVIFNGETHNTVPWSAINPILRFALPGGQDHQGTIPR